MRIIEIDYRDHGFNSYRAACVRSLYNVDDAGFQIRAELPLSEKEWALGAVIGPSGTGKSSIGRAIWGPEAVLNPADNWPNDPIVDAIAPNGDWQTVTTALAAVGLGSVPAWLRPYEALSTGEKFRADLARLAADPPTQVVIDEFSSVVDRQIAQIGSLAFAKVWRRNAGKQAVVLSCHYDILPWLDPDWVFDTADRQFYWARGRLQRPPIQLDIHATNWRFWPAFEKHHYLKLPNMIAATCYVGLVDGLPVTHLAVSTRPGLIEARACRLVVMPEWQGAGLGIKFLEAVCLLWRHGHNRYQKPMRTIFHTSHPGLAAALRKSPKWTQISSGLRGDDKARSAKSLEKAMGRNVGYGGHFRAVQGFRFLGE